MSGLGHVRMQADIASTTIVSSRFSRRVELTVVCAGGCVISLLLNMSNGKGMTVSGRASSIADGILSLPGVTVACLGRTTMLRVWISE